MFFNKFFTFAFLLYAAAAFAQSPITRDIKSFGAKGDGKTNDHSAFEAAADFFNKRGGNGKLIISKGVYLVGRQIVTNGQNGRFNWEGQDVLHFTNIKNFSVEGAVGTILRYAPNMKYGAFNPQTGKPRTEGGYFVNNMYAASLGHCIFIDKSQNVTVQGLELNGNNEGVFLGGSYGDVGIQLPHYGIFIQNCKSVNITKMYVHHFGQDGICVANVKTDTPDKIRFSDSRFEYNARQGFSWIGGNDMVAKNCKFNHTGRGKFASAPGAGLDVEAEYGPCRNGVFDNCEFEDSFGCCMVADSGDGGYCTFTNCTFWSSVTWSIWTTKPGFTFKNCKIYGPIVHGYDSPNDRDATKFINCEIEDKPYNGKHPAGEYLIETNNAKRVRFENCNVVAHYKKLFWISINPALKPEEKYQLINCKFFSDRKVYVAGDYICVFRGAYYKNSTFKYNKQYSVNMCCEPYNADGGGNRFITFP
jgi:hypothetical protein